MSRSVFSACDSSFRSVVAAGDAFSARDSSASESSSSFVVFSNRASIALISRSIVSSSKSSSKSSSMSEKSSFSRSFRFEYSEGTSSFRSGITV